MITEASYQFFDLFLGLESVARLGFREAKLSAYYAETPDSPTVVTLGLPELAYQYVYRPKEMERLVLELPNMDSLSALQTVDGGTSLSGEESLSLKVKAAVDGRSRTMGKNSISVVYPLFSAISSFSILRSCFHAASRMNATMFVSDGCKHGKLQRILSPWMIDTFEQPLDLLLIRSNNWALYHFQTHCAFESSDWFFEAEGLLDQIQTTYKGGMTNG